MADSERYIDKGGRPLAFETPEALQAVIDSYYKWAEENKKPLTISRLGVFIGTDRTTINNYSKRDKFFNTIKKAREKILADKEENLNSANGNKAGVIFDLKNNHGYVDKSEVGHEVIPGAFEKFCGISNKELMEKLNKLTKVIDNESSDT